MDLKKLFGVLVVGGSVLTATSGCTQAVAAEAKGEKAKRPNHDGKAAADAGTAKGEGGGVQGW